MALAGRNRPGARSLRADSQSPDSRKTKGCEHLDPIHHRPEIIAKVYKPCRPYSAENSFFFHEAAKIRKVAGQELRPPLIKYSFPLVKDS